MERFSACNVVLLQHTGGKGHIRGEKWTGGAATVRSVPHDSAGHFGALGSAVTAAHKIRCGTWTVGLRGTYRWDRQSCY